MGTITIENDSFIYVEEERKCVLLNCRDYLANKSRVPMHSLTGDMTIGELIISLFKINPELCEGTGEINFRFESLLLDVLTASYLSRTALPVRVLEIGAVSGVISYHLAALLGIFNPDSLLCCVSDTLGNESGSEWLDRVSLVQNPPRLSFMAADYNDTQLQESNFDVVLINGTVNFDEPYAVIQEARRLVSGAGMLLCYSIDESLLESSFKLTFSQRTEYQFAPHSNIMVVRDVKAVCEDAQREKEHQDVNYLIEKIRGAVSDKEEIDTHTILLQIEKYLQIAVEKKDVKKKQQLIDSREILLNNALLH